MTGSIGPATKDAADAAKKSAIAAKNSAEANAIIAQSAERTTKLESAGVWFDSMQMSQGDAPMSLAAVITPIVGKATFLGFKIINNGRTPATDATLERVYVELGDRTVAATPWPGRGTIATGATATWFVSLGNIFQQASDIQSMYVWPPQQHGLHVVAILAYNDVYGETHRVRACYESAFLYTSAVTLSNSELSVYFLPCEGNNTVPAKQDKEGQRRQ